MIAKVKWIFVQTWSEHPTLLFELRNVIELEEEVLSANETYAWQIEVELPENAQYPFRGRFCQFSHLAQAGVSCFGNDPDSGWIEFS